MTKIEYAIKKSEEEYTEEQIIKDFCPSDFFMKDSDKQCCMGKRSTQLCTKCWNSIKEG